MGAATYMAAAPFRWFPLLSWHQGYRTEAVAAGDRLTTGGIVEQLIAAAQLAALAFYVVTTGLYDF